MTATPFVLPAFDALDINTVEHDLRALLKNNQQSIETLTEMTEPTWETFVYPLDVLADALDRFWSPVRHLNAVQNSSELRDVYNAGRELISAYSTELGQNAALYQQYEKLRQSAEYATLSPGQQKTIDDNLLGFRLSGVSLPPAEKTRFREIALRLSELSSRFSEHVLDATNAWTFHVTDEGQLTGLPEHAKKAAQLRAEAQEKTGWLFNLEFPTYYAIQTFAADRGLRETFYRAYATRGSDQGPHNSAFNNDDLMAEILSLRAEQAALLGFDSYADLSVATKMVESPAQVVDFLQELVTKCRPAGEAEFAELQAFAAGLEPGITLQAWDISYYANKLKEDKFSISDDDLKPYFPADTAIPGMFAVVGRLFGLRIEKDCTASVWHEDVEFYRIEDASGELRGGFYLDTYARENKRGGAWMDVCVTRMRHPDALQLPVAYLTCNLTPPVGDEPALLTHAEVTTLFHEFGHGLHHMLTQVDYRDVSGIHGVEWDAVELPSQFLENWCWEQASLDMISAHYQTGEKIPRDLLEKARAAKNFQSAMMMLRQLEFALFDMRLHGADAGSLTVQQVLDTVRNEVAVVPVPAFNRFQNSFGHIFSGGYAAGYFSYKWAEVLSADAFSRFEEEGIFNADTGSDFMRCILEQGGTRKALVLFRDFRGREPDISALLRHSGLAA